MFALKELAEVVKTAKCWACKIHHAEILEVVSGEIALCLKQEQCRRMQEQWQALDLKGPIHFTASPVVLPPCST